VQHKHGRWQLFAILAFMYILVYFYRVSMAVVASDLSRDLNLDAKQLGILAGVLFYIYALAQLPLGPLIDRLGGRKVISFCGLLTASGGFLFATAQNAATAMLGRALIGIGTAAVLMGAFAIYSRWYSKSEFGKISGLMVAVGNLGNLAGTAPLALLVGITGWRAVFSGIALLQLLATLLVFWLVRDLPPKAESKPKEQPEPEPARPDMLTAWRSIARDRSFWLLSFIAFGWYGNYLAVQGLWGGPYLMEVFGMSREAAGKILIWTSIGFIMGSVVIDNIARRVFRSYKWTLFTGQLFLLLLMTGFQGWLDSLSPLLLSVYFLLLGFAVASGIMIYPIIRNSFPLGIVGTALTSLNFFVLLGAATVQHTMGLLLQNAGGYSPAALHYAFALPPSILFIALLFYSTAKNCPAK